MSRTIPKTQEVKKHVLSKDSKVDVNLRLLIQPTERIAHIWVFIVWHPTLKTDSYYFIVTRHIQSFIMTNKREIVTPVFVYYFTAY